MKISLLFVASALLIVACAEVTPVTEHRYAAVSPQSVQVLYQEPQRPYEMLAFVHKTSNAFTMRADIESLQEDAAELGADAIIVTGAHGAGFAQYAEANAKAIKWTGKKVAERE